jgi:hypothetical protein
MKYQLWPIAAGPAKEDTAERVGDRDDAECLDAQHRIEAAYRQVGWQMCRDEKKLQATDEE